MAILYPFNIVMRKDVHPTYYPEAKVTCVCGNVFTVGSTAPEINVEICSTCHPFYSGKQKLVDTARRLDKFNKRVEAKSAAATGRKGKKVKKATQAERKQTKRTTAK